MHPKMKYTYVGVDSHKDSHTAVFLDCFFEKLGEIQFENLPSKFAGFLDSAMLLQQDGTTLLFGLEDVSMYGRALAVFLTDNGQKVKHINALLVARERRNRNVTEKTDSVDAECAARVLLSKFSELPDADPQDKYWTLRALVVRRDFIVKSNIALKNNLRGLLAAQFPNYHKFFFHIDCDTSLAFFARYPSPSTLEGTSVEELTAFLQEASKKRVGERRARMILDSLECTRSAFQEIRDEVVRSTIRQIQWNLGELESLEESLVKILDLLGTTLASMTGIDVVCEAQILSCIGDIKRFPTSAKLAQYAGIAPVTYASGKTDKQFANRRGNRELNSLFYCLAVRVSTVNRGKVMNQFFNEYYQRKLSEGKTKAQALKCVQRRLVNIIWGMLTRGEKYVNPPIIDLPREEKDAIMVSKQEP